MKNSLVPTLLIATGNPGKAREFAEIFSPLGWRVLSLADLPAVPEPEEVGRTFLANACLKASAYARAHTGLGGYVLADDSGLEVDALGGAPGVDSAYWASVSGRAAPDERHARDAANSAVLLEQLAATPDPARTARFVCTLALAGPDARILLTARGTVEGSILRAPRGTNGFGYDPLFLVPSLGRTTAELTPAEKHALSHRGNAVRELLPLMRAAGLTFST